MQMVVRKLLGLSLKSTLKVMGSNSIRSNSEIWISVIREKLTDIDAKAWAEFAYSQIDKLSEGRNDFVHALYGVDLRAMIPDAPSNLFMVAHREKASDFIRQAESTAIRLRSHSPSSLTSLPDLLKRTAKVSVIAAYLDDVCAATPDPVALATWRKRLGSRLPPEPPKVEAKKGKGRLGRPQPSLP